jgi:hypothetical protein
MLISTRMSNPIYSSALMLGAGLVGAISFAAPTQAATFAVADIDFEFSNFSIQPFSVGVSANPRSLEAAVEGEVFSEALAGARFNALPPDPVGAENFVLNFTTGEGKNYRGEAQGDAGVVGKFRVGADETLSFDFEGSLRLAAGVERPLFETATASGLLNFDVSTVKRDGSTGQHLDEFSLSAALNPRGVTQYGIVRTSSIQLDSPPPVDQKSQGNESFFTVNVSGTYNRLFKRGQTIQLNEAKLGQATVSASPTPIPEPLTIFGSVLAVGMGGWLRKQYLQTHRGTP